MAGYRANTELLFTGSDLCRSRWAVEREKMDSQFPGFSFYGRDGRISSVQGDLTTNYGNTYHVKIKITERYPYVLPEIELPVVNQRNGTLFKPNTLA